MTPDKSNMSEFKESLIRINQMANALTCILTSIADQDDAYINLESTVSSYYIDGHLALVLFQAIEPDITKIEISNNDIIVYKQGRKWLQIQRKQPNAKGLFLNSIQKGIWE